MESVDSYHHYNNGTLSYCVLTSFSFSVLTTHLPGEGHCTNARQPIQTKCND